MKRDITFLTAIYTVSLLIGGIGSIIPLQPIRVTVQYLAYAVPVFFALVYIRRRGRVDEDEAPFAFGIKREKIAPAALLFAPSIAVIMLAAALTSLALSALGYKAPEPDRSNFLLGLVIHALLPSVLEELLFRYIPIKILNPRSGRWCVILSTLFFSLSHLNLFQIPYAAVAGVIFVLIDIYAGGVLPSMVIHFLNNALSLTMMYGYLDGIMPAGFVLIGIALCAFSIIGALIIKKRYFGFFSPLNHKGSEPIYLGAPAIFALCTVMISLISLIGSKI